MRGVRIRGVTYMGAELTHARFNACVPLHEGGRPAGRYSSAECVLFRKAQEMKPLLEGEETVELTGTINLQVWKGQERVQFVVEDIKREK